MPTSIQPCGTCVLGLFMCYRGWITAVPHMPSIQLCPPDIHNITHPKPLELESWHFERMFTPHLVPTVSCLVSCVTCHLSNVISHMSQKNTKWWSLLVEGLLSTGPTLSSLILIKLKGCNRHQLFMRTIFAIYVRIFLSNSPMKSY